jgi:ferredoxin
MEQKYLTKAALDNWVGKLCADVACVCAPVAGAGGKVDFRQIKSAAEISWNHVQTAQSAKAATFPRAEQLFAFTKTQGDVALQDYDVSALPETVIFGLHPCDVRAGVPLAALLNIGSADLPHSERRQRLTLIGVACTQSDEYCFCTSVGGNPAGTDGSDILLTYTGDGYLAEIVTDKGKTFVEKYASLFTEPVNVNKDAHLATVPVRFDFDVVKQKLAAMFDSDVWQTQSARCIGCGACAFVCPACACFDIQEDAQMGSGRRLRCWDSCGFAAFTQHTSGHNPRPTQSARWRQRLMHKFVYMPQSLQVAGCTGCGRCSRACPTDMNLAGHLEGI